jgi:segregation and condensation protein B
MTELARILEALLFLSSDPVSVEDLAEACEVEAAAVAEAIDELRAEFAQGRRGLLLREVAGGFTLASDPIAETAARRLLAKPRIASLTPAQMETLAIVAYLQPISRPEMARIRGVNTDSPVGSLLDRGLIEESGRSSFGAVMYRTTPLFLKLFGLGDTSALPDVSEWDPSPEEQAELRDRLLRAGEARAGIGSPPSEAAPEAVGSDGQ